jgi:hypothetical protein
MTHVESAQGPKCVCLKNSLRSKSCEQEVHSWLTISIHLLTRGHSVIKPTIFLRVARFRPSWTRQYD